MLDSRPSSVQARRCGHAPALIDQLFVGAIVPRGFLPSETRKASAVEAEIPLDELRR
jgi:hypothetical protein